MPFFAYKKFFPIFALSKVDCLMGVDTFKLLTFIEKLAMGDAYEIIF